MINDWYKSFQINHISKKHIVGQFNFISFLIMVYNKILNLHLQAGRKQLISGLLSLKGMKSSKM